MIFDGNKRVELRRVRPRHLNEGDLILVYATSPEKALLGVLEVEKVVEMSPINFGELSKIKLVLTMKLFKNIMKIHQMLLLFSLKNHSVLIRQLL
jgi:predicted transcriptional regulator